MHHASPAEPAALVPAAKPRAGRHRPPTGELHGEDVLDADQLASANTAPVKCHFSGVHSARWRHHHCMLVR